MDSDSTLLTIKDPVECIIIKRLNRFVVEVSYKGKKRRAYINNTGRLHEYLVPGRKAFCQKKNNTGKTDYRLFAVEDMGKGALIDTLYQMKAFENAVNKNLIPWLKGCRIIGRNPRLASSILDFLLECNGSLVYVETKSAVLRGDHVYAMYPDCPTLRGRRHILELTEHVSKGGKGILIFVAALPGVKFFRPYREGDPVLTDILRESVKKGLPVKGIALHYEPGPSIVVLDNPNLKVVVT